MICEMSHDSHDLVTRCMVQLLSESNDIDVSEVLKFQSDCNRQLPVHDASVKAVQAAGAVVDNAIKHGLEDIAVASTLPRCLVD